MVPAKHWFVFLAMSQACVPNDTQRPDAGSKAATPPQKRPKGTALRSLDPMIATPFREEFSRRNLGPLWRASSSWEIDKGALCAKGARNRGAWLARRLPRNARIEFDAVSYSPEGDIKAELWGDGHSGATSVSYTNATSYLVIFGGWKNHFHVLARLNEHAANRLEIRVDPGSSNFRFRPVVPERKYHFKVERTDGKTLRWFVDGVEMLTLEDAAPLVGLGHDHMGFNEWQVRVCFDNLSITPLKE